MSYYNWPDILKKYSDKELNKIVRDSRTEPKEKVAAAITELDIRGFDTNIFKQVRDANFQIIIEDKSICFFCKSKGLKESDKYCPNCAFPQGGSQIEMKDFILNVNKKKELLEKQNNAINKARNILFILSGMNVLVGLFLGLIISVNVPIIIGCLIGASIYLSLGLWSRIHAFPAILSGLFVYIVFIVLAAISDPHTIYQGIFWKILIISGFIYGYKGAKESKILEKELNSMNEAKDLNTENDLS